MMIPEANRPELPAFAKIARKDPEFIIKAQLARMALLDTDPRAPKAEDDGTHERFDEYQVLALMACSGIDMGLIRELPIMHIVGIVQRTANTPQSILTSPQILLFGKALRSTLLLSGST